MHPSQAILQIQLAVFQRAVSLQMSDFAEQLSAHCLPMQSGVSTLAPSAVSGVPGFRQAATAQIAPQHEDPFASCTMNPLVNYSPELLPDLTPSEPEDAWGFPPDPFEGSQLSGFSLSAVGSAFSGRRGGEAPEERERTLVSRPFEQRREASQSAQRQGRAFIPTRVRHLRFPLKAYCSSGFPTSYRGGSGMEGASRAVGSSWPRCLMQLGAIGGFR